MTVDVLEFIRRVSKILQRWVSNPCERGTGGREPKGEWVWEVLHFFDQNGEFLRIPGYIY